MGADLEAAASQVVTTKVLAAAVDGSETIEVTVNQVPSRAASSALSTLDWPRPTSFATARTSFVMVRVDG